MSDRGVGTASPAALRPRKATTADLPDVTDTLALVFYDDPVVMWCIDDASRRRELLPGFFGAVAGSYLAYDETYSVDEGVSAAVWAPPGAWARVRASMTRETGANPVRSSPLSPGSEPEAATGRESGTAGGAVIREPGDPDIGRGKRPPIAESTSETFLSSALLGAGIFQFFDPHISNREGRTLQVQCHGILQRKLVILEVSVIILPVD